MVLIKIICKNGMWFPKNLRKRLRKKFWIQANYFKILTEDKR